jgi:hypothetical protein
LFGRWIRSVKYNNPSSVFESKLANAKMYICIGTDLFHTPPSVRDAIIAAAEGEGYSVAVDAPFAGAVVPLSSYQQDRRILSVMIEVNRRLYMDERTGQKRNDFGTVRAAVGRLIVAAAEAAAHRRGGRSIASGRRIAPHRSWKLSLRSTIVAESLMKSASRSGRRSTGPRSGV